MLHHLIRTQEQRVTESSTCSQDGIVRTLINYSQIQNQCGKKALRYSFDSSSSSSNYICFCLLPSLWFVVEIFLEKF